MLVGLSFKKKKKGEEGRPAGENMGFDVGEIISNRRKKGKEKGEEGRGKGEAIVLVNRYI